MAGAPRHVTLTGLKIMPNPHASLEVICNRLLKVLGKLPEDYIYRQCTEKMIHEKMEILKNNPDREAAEKKLGVKYLEELHSQLYLEFLMARRMQVWKPWEDLCEEAPKDQWTWPPHK